MSPPIPDYGSIGSSTFSDLMRTVNFAALKHREQRRKDADGTPYINHPVGVATILAHEGDVTDPFVLQAALLHDTVEDTDTTLDEIEQVFGSRMRGVIDEVSDDKTLEKDERKRLQIEHAPHASPEAKLVKLADKLHNLRDLEVNVPVGWEQKRVDEYYRWSAKVCYGLRGANANLESELEKIFKKRGLTMTRESGSDEKSSDPAD